MKKRILRLSCIYLGLLGLGLLYLILFRGFGFTLPCMFHEMTGWNCPGCGLTRAAGAISRGSFAEAFGYNPMIVLYGMYGVWFAGTATARYLRGEKDALIFGPNWVHVVMLTLTILFGILRNIVNIDTI